MFAATAKLELIDSTYVEIRLTGLFSPILVDFPIKSWNKECEAENVELRDDLSLRRISFMRRSAAYRASYFSEFPLGSAQGVPIVPFSCMDIEEYSRIKFCSGVCRQVFLFALVYQESK